MLHVFRHFVACIFAAALIWNGSTGGVLANVQAAKVQHGVATKAEAGHQKQHDKHHHALSDGAIAALDDAPEHDHAGDGVKCCTMCISFDNLMPAFAPSVSLFHHYLVDFKIDRPILIGHLVALDPDIPKTIV